MIAEVYSSEESPDCAKQGTEGNLRLVTASSSLLKRSETDGELTPFESNRNYFRPKFVKIRFKLKRAIPPAATLEKVVLSLFWLDLRQRHRQIIIKSIVKF